MKRIQQYFGNVSPPYLILAFILLFFGKDVLPLDQKFIGGLDVAEYFFWHEQFLRENLRAGTLPLWNPYYYSGHPFLANPQTFIFYPATLLFITLPMPWAFNIDTIFHLFLAALGMFYFVRLLTGSGSAGTAAGLAYALSGYFMDNLLAGHLTMIHTAALLPWIFYFFEKGYLTGHPFFFVVSGIIFGLQILGGEPQNNFYTAIFITFFFMTRGMIDFFISKEFRLIRHSLYFCLVPFVGIGISMAQILPSLEFMSLSDRSQNTYEFATNWSFPPRNFFTFLVPKPQTPMIHADWEFSGYIGIIGLVLAGIGAFFSPHRRYAWIFLGMVFLSAVIMLGGYTPVYRIFFEMVPGFSAFRIPARGIVIFVFSLGVLAGLGFSTLSEGTLAKRNRGSLYLGMILLILILWAGGNSFQIPMMSKEMGVAAGLLVGVLLLLVLFNRLGNRYLIGPVFIAILFVDLYWNYQGQIPVLNQERLLKQFPFEVTIRNDPGLYRIAVPKWQMRGMTFDYQGINGYTPISLDSYYYFIHKMADIPVPKNRRQKLSPQLFRPESVFSSRILGIKYAVVSAQNGHRLLKNPAVFPRSVLVKDRLVIPKLEDHLRFLKNPKFNPLQTVLLDRPPPAATFSPSGKGDLHRGHDEVEITHYSPNRIHLKSFSSSSGYLVLSELFYPGWEARVDGREVPVLRANFLLRAVPLAPGEHEIIFQFQPFSVYAGVSVSILTLLVLAGFGLSARIKPKWKWKHGPKSD